VSALVVCLPRSLHVPFFESALARTRILVFTSFLTSSHVDLVGFTHLGKLEFVDVTARFLDFVNKVENGFVITVKITSDLSGRLRSHLLDGVEHLFEFEAMLAEDPVREVVEVGLAAFAPVLLSVLAGGSSLDDLVTFAMDVGYRLAEAGETETLKPSLTRWKKT
jgi:hypothetical protein